MSKRTTTIAIFAALALLGSGLALVGILFAINRADVKLDEERLRVATREAHRANLGSLERLIEETVAEREQISSFIIAEDKVVDFLALLKTIGEEQGVTLTTKSLTVLTDKTQFEKLSVSIYMEGTYERLIRMIAILETLPYQSGITLASIGRDSSNRNVWTGSFQIQVTKQKAP